MIARLGQNTESYVPHSFREVRGFSYAPMQTSSEKIQERVPTLYHPYWRRLECLKPFVDVIVKAAHSL